MTNSRINVTPPVKAPLEHGLFAVVEGRSQPTTSGRIDPHWKNGVTWQNTCPDAGSTYDQCIQANSLGVAVTGIAEPAPKAATADRSIWGATPFTVLVEVDCSAPGFYDRADEIVRETFTQSEQVEVESVFSSGAVGGVTDLAFPHLAAAAGLVETEPGGAVLQLQTGNLGPTGGGALDVVEALGRVEAALGTCVKGKGVIHIPAALLSHFVAEKVARLGDDGVYRSPAGHAFAVGAGYNGASPAGVVEVGQLWIYATGPVFMYASEGKFVGEKRESLDRDVNTLKRIYERTYVLGFDCCLFGVAVSTGGVVTGAIDSAV